MNVQEAMATLELIELTEEGLNAAYKVAVKKTHPDHGGSAEAFHLVMDAATVLTSELRTDKTKKPKKAKGDKLKINKCAKCKGQGRIDQRRAWTVMKVRCPACKGAGVVK